MDLIGKKQAIIQFLPCLPIYEITSSKLLATRKEQMKDV